MPRSIRAIALPSLIALLLALPQPTFASSLDSLVLESQSGGIYDYDLVVPTSFIVGPGTAITLTGLSGVTGASVFGPLAGPGIDMQCALTVTSTSASSVTVSQDPGGVRICDFSDGTYGTLEVDSTVTTDGTVDYVLGNAEGSGTVQGPVASVTATPEPSSLLLLSTGLLGFAGAARRKGLGDAA